MATVPTPVPGQLGRYQILRRLGTGGMAEVFLTRSEGVEGIEKILVVKRILPTFARSAKFISMFVEEAKIATRLNHPNIVQVYAFEHVDNQFLLAMEFVDGTDLGRLVSAAKRKEKRIPHGLCALVVMEVAKGLDYAHRRRDSHGDPMDIVHRDVSPQNILLSYEGAVKIADFGIAKARKMSEESGIIKGKFTYMAPEQARGQRVDRRSDVYSLGVLLAELLMGRAMFPGRQGVDVLDDVRKGNITMPDEVDSAVDAQLARIVRRATQVQPDRRFRTAREFATALRNHLHAGDEVYDAETLEQFIGKIIPRELTTPDASHEYLGEARTGSVRSEDTLLPSADLEHKERRHVVVVVGHLRAHRMPGANHVIMGERAARVLSDIAFKNEAVISWPEGSGQGTFRYILGLKRSSVHDPLSALVLAMDVVEALHGIAPDLEQTLDQPLHVGVAVSRGVVSTVRDPQGRLLRYEPDAAVIQVADSIASSAAPSEILCAGEVYRLARRVFVFDSQPRSVTLPQGLARKSLRAHVLLGARAQDEVQSDTEQGEDLVGRHAEVSVLVDTYQDAVTNQQSLALAISGELGIGKTHLVRAAIERMDPAPRVLRVECTFGSADTPFSAAMQLVREAAGLTDNMDPRAARERLRAYMASISQNPDEAHEIADSLQALATSDPTQALLTEHAAVTKLLRAAHQFIRRLAESGPVVVWLDALQWADRASLELLGAINRQTFNGPLLAVLSSRPEACVEQIMSGVPYIEIQELGPADSRELIRRRFGTDQIPADIMAAVVERAAGNPLFITELIEALLERGVVSLVQSGEQQTVERNPDVPMALPTTLEGVIAARLDELGEEERRALRWVSVAGPGNRIEELGRIAGNNLSDRIRHLCDRGLLTQRHDETVAFTHAVFRQVVYRTADREDLLRMHKRLAHWLTKERPTCPSSVIAKHLERADDTDAASEAYLRAATIARAAYANRESLRLFRKALDLMDKDPARRFHIHEAQEQMLRGMGHATAQKQQLESMRSLAESTGDPAMLAITHNRIARHELDAARTSGVRETLKSSLRFSRRANDVGSEIEALRLAARLAALEGNLETGLQAGERAIELCGTRRERLSARGSVMIERAVLLRRSGRIDDAMEAHAEAVAIFQRLGFKRNQSTALNAMGLTLAFDGRWEDALVALRGSLFIDREIGDYHRIGSKLADVGQIYADLGNVAQSGSFLKRAEETFAACNDNDGRIRALATLAEVHTEYGEHLQLARDYLKVAAEITEQQSTNLSRSRVGLAAAQLDAALDRFDDAAAELEAIERIIDRSGLPALRATAESLKAWILVKQGRVDEARGHAEDALKILNGSDTVERSERILVNLARTYQELQEPTARSQAYERAHTIVQMRLSLMRDERTRSLYEKTPWVSEIFQSVSNPS